ncbi:MAG: ion transporter [Aureispira sp.]|nr:ion transporter [Aureispira sp.]
MAQETPKHRSELAPWQNKIHDVIFEADTPMGKIFDVALLILIVLSVLAVMLESVASINAAYKEWFFISEWVFTILFTIEYVLRLICIHKPMKYAGSFFGIIDLLSILPTYIGLFFSGTPYFAAVRALRLIRVFRVFKLGKFLKEGDTIMKALRASQPKIIVFLTFILMMAIVLGSFMYFVEGGQDSGFTSIPRSVYWAIVTLTTVGYGDIAPHTPLGQLIAAMIMILGYGVIAVPTGIVTAEIVNDKPDDAYSTQSCQTCMKEGHDKDADFCKFCGTEL